MSARHILVIDDEARIREVVEYALQKDGFRVSVASDGESGLARHEADPADLIVLDIGLPGADGLEICRQLRRTSNTPVLFLSARGEEIDRVVGLELGGDDYLTKPFSPRELLARIKAVLRRTMVTPAMEETKTLSHGAVSIDLERHLVRCGDVAIALTPTEFSVLAALYTRPGIVFSRARLVERAYEMNYHVTERTIDTYVRRIRHKFRPHAVDPIETVHGVGYKAPEP